MVVSAELRRHDIKTVRHTFAELEELAQIDPESKRLLLPSPLQPDAEPLEVAVIYYRSAYTPTDYPSATEWETRLLLERSQAIKCPSMALQLAGAKKIQQVLAEPGVLEDFLLGSNRPDVGGCGEVAQDVDRVMAHGQFSPGARGLSDGIGGVGPIRPQAAERRRGE
jgi:hypothetical protein